MTTLRRSPPPGAHRLRAYLGTGWADVATRFGNLFAWEQDTDTARATEAAARAAAYDSQVLRHAAFANSPHEVDWLLYAAILTDATKQRYCLERALAINPSSDLAQRALARLAPPDGEVAGLVSSTVYGVLPRKRGGGYGTHL
jgi:hypothetical protein